MKQRRAYHNKLLKRMGQPVNNPDLGHLYSVVDAAEAIGCTENGMRTWIRDRRIEYVKIGRRVLIPERALVELIERGTVPAITPASRTGKEQTDGIY